MIAAYNNPKSLLLACFALLLFNTVTYSQRSLSDYDDESRGTDYLGNGSGAESFDCIEFFRDTAQRQNMHVKRIVASDFWASDTSFADKHTNGRRVWLFNSKGRETMYVHYDTAGKCKDSLIFRYDKNGHLSESFTYRRSDTGLITKMNSEVIVRNKEEQITKDSSWVKELDAADYPGKSSISVSYSKYDDKGNCIFVVSVRNGDTLSFNTYQFDSKNRVIMGKSKYEGAWGTTFKKYDDSSNIMEETDYNRGDTTDEVYTYDTKNRVLTDMKYDKGKLTDKISNVYNADGSSTSIEEEHKTSELLDIIPTCDILKTTITKTDPHGLEILKVTKRNQGNDTVTETDVNKYTYTPGGKVISDTDISTEAEGIWNSSTTITIHENKYDAHENRLEEMTLGDEVASGERRATYTYNDKDEALEVSHYSSCDDVVPFRTEVYSYYPDGVTLKQARFGILHISYGKDSRVLNVMHMYHNSAEQAVITYEE